MKHTYEKRISILTLFTFFALALGSQRSFGQNLVTNGTFDNNVENWTLSTDGNDTLEYDTDGYNSSTGSAKLTRDTSGDTNNSPFFHQNIPLNKGKTYNISFYHKGDGRANFKVKKPSSNSAETINKVVTSNATWTESTNTDGDGGIQYTATESGDHNFRIFNAKSVNSYILIDNIKVVESGCDISIETSYSCGEFISNTNYTYTATVTLTNNEASAKTFTTSAGIFESSASTNINVDANSVITTTINLNQDNTSFTITTSDCTSSSTFTTTCNYFISDGNGSKAWGTNTNWSKGTKPSETDDVIVVNDLGSSNNVKINSIEIRANKTFDHWNDNSVSIVNDITIKSNGTLKNRETLSAKNLTIETGGIYNASIINSDSGSLLESSLELSGDLNNEGTIILSSDATGAANIKANNANNTGNISYKLFTPKTERTGLYNSSNPTDGISVKVGLISPPLNGMKFGNLWDNNNDLLTEWKYNGGSGNSKLFGPYVNGSYVNYFSDGLADGDDQLNDNTIVVSGIGYRVSLFEGTIPNGNNSSTDNFIEFTGDILTGNQTATVGSNDDGWDLIGNPYTTGLSLKAFVSENNNLLEDLTTGITYWDNTLITPAFVTKTKAELDATDGDIVIPPGQAFFVRPKTGTTSVNFTTSQQQIQTGASFNRNSNALEGFNITLSNSDINKTTKVYLNNTTTLGVDKGHEAAAIGLSTKGIGIYTVIADLSRTEALAIQSIPNNSIENTTLKLGVNASLGEHTLSLEGINLPENVNVYLTDLANGSETLLNKHDYTFNVTNAPLEGADRFVISFQSDALSTGDHALDQLQIVAFQNTIIVKGALENNTALKVYDLQGRLVAKTVLSDSNRQLNLNNSTGVYVVSLSNVQGNKTQKVILK